MVPTFLPTGGSRRISASASDRAGSGGKRRSHMGLQITHVWYITTTLIIQKLSDSDKIFSRNTTTTKTTKSAYWGRYNSYYLQILLLFFYILLLYYHSFFRLRTQLIAGSLISLFFIIHHYFYDEKNDIKSYISFIITNPFSSISTPLQSIVFTWKNLFHHTISLLLF